ncbi:hypothetical protein CSUI_002723 [Cystoisospora suis]|uniref:Uncharacterized protein n=1 Tax=Cystoisospora suis TaxID=483139 RepID=A0A2C6L3M4_9APIC|nr:hypothetical protein CSUI_002723 [Cystoisospora suis]
MVPEWYFSAYYAVVVFMSSLRCRYTPRNEVYIHFRRKKQRCL